ncbi:MAG: tRNA lysidine(34) synthetase TilS [Candidatus Liberibacter ctenarytainae]|uniref:tRNA(Ile)-lysidine synthase n=1 Tax=Candidatus Liberibacter ctenarytainae TaxID=2020335 RepID=A0A937DM44_9HYPH|nr:tRNA lysidine(34) synthetase TilS [Candidatus Liberibacter ctenarytainae]
MFLSPIERMRCFVHSIICPAHILVAVSGGSDSVGLLIALHSVLLEKSFRGIRFSAVSVDHGMRDEAKDEVRYVSDLCFKLGIPHAIVIWKGSKPKTGLMAAAREARYALISDHAVAISATLVVTAHTFNDQLETVYMRSQRDSSGQGIGLAGISEIILYDLKLWIMRPFLQCLRSEIRSFLREKNISWCEDPSNVDDKFERVRVRNLIGDSDFNLMFKKIEESQNWRIMLNNHLSELIPQYLKVYWQSVISISRDVLMIDPVLLFYLIRFSVAICGGQNFLPKYRSVERVIAFLQGGNRGCISIGRVIIDVRSDFLWVTRAIRGLSIQNISSEETAIWDRRNKFTSVSNRSIQMFPQAYRDMITPDHIPPIVVKRAFLSMSSQREGLPLTLFSRFLTSFDFPIAEAFFAAFGKKNIPKLPFYNGKV